MKTIALLSLIALASLGLSAQADDTAKKAELVAAASAKIAGEGTCAKCDLKIAGIDKCQNAIVVTGADGKKETLLCDANDVSKAFHSNVCKGAAKVTAEGVVTEKDGKKTIALTKIELAK